MVNPLFEEPHIPIVIPGDLESMRVAIDVMANFIRTNTREANFRINLSSGGRKIPSIMDPPFNAKGTEFADDTAALQAAVGQTVFFPIPDWAYNISDEIVITNDTHWIGAGTGLTNGSGFVSPEESQIRWIGGNEPAKAMFRVSPTPVMVEMPASTAPITNVSIDHLTLWGGGATGVGFGTYVARAQTCRFGPMFIQQTTQHGFYEARTFINSVHKDIICNSNQGCGITIGRALHLTEAFDSPAAPPVGFFEIDAGTGEEKDPQVELTSYQVWVAQGGYAVNGGAWYRITTDGNGLDETFDYSDSLLRQWGYGTGIYDAFWLTVHSFLAQLNDGAGAIIVHAGGTNKGIRHAYIEANAIDAVSSGVDLGIMFLEANNAPLGPFFAEDIYLNPNQAIVQKGNVPGTATSGDPIQLRDIFSDGTNKIVVDDMVDRWYDIDGAMPADNTRDLDLSAGLQNGWAVVDRFVASRRADRTFINAFLQHTAPAGANTITTTGTAFVSVAHVLSVDDWIQVTTGPEQYEVQQVATITDVDNGTLVSAFSVNQAGQSWVNVVGLAFGKIVNGSIPSTLESNLVEFRPAVHNEGENLSPTLVKIDGDEITLGENLFGSIGVKRATQLHLNMDWEINN